MCYSSVVTGDKAWAHGNNSQAQWGISNYGHQGKFLKKQTKQQVIQNILYYQALEFSVSLWTWESRKCNVRGRI